MKYVLLIACLLLAFVIPARGAGQVEFNAATGASSGAFHVQHLQTTHAAAGENRLALVGLGLGSDIYNPNVNCEYGGLQMSLLTYSGGVQGGYTMYVLYLIAPPTGPQTVYCSWSSAQTVWARLNVISLTGVNQIAPIFSRDDDCCTSTFSAGQMADAPVGSLGVDFLLVSYPGPYVTLGPGQTLNVDAFAWQKTHMLSSRKYAGWPIEMGESWQNLTSYDYMVVIINPASD